MTSNTALADEIEAVNSIYDAQTLSVTNTDEQSTSVVLTLPDQPLSFSISFSQEYPEVPPQLTGTQSTGPNAKRGEGEATLLLLRDVLGQIYTPGQVCLFDLIEEITPLLQQQSSSKASLSAADTSSEPNHDTSEDQDQAETTKRSAATTTTIPTSSSSSSPPPLSQLSNLHIKDLTSTSSTAVSSGPHPPWTLSDPLVVNKSTFIARALSVSDLDEATRSISHLLSTNKKVASATHNITAWRIKTKSTKGSSSSSRKEDGGGSGEAGGATVPEITIQDCDDDGETAAGGRLLHLMQLMGVWNVVVVVTRWYGGVKLGPDRFRCINMVAREALVRCDFGVEEGGKEKGKRSKK